MVSVEILLGSISKADINRPCLVGSKSMVGETAPGTGFICFLSGHTGGY